ncbi:LacI family DNA-binding transcriptional regulator [Micrococcales bacterium 31B]|nr:LacI family DNA-binding transcriptional regulator [Micrococcales bacterium 31B]
MPATLADVARRCGVSPATASRVLNGSTRRPAEHIAEKVMQAASELGYIPNAQAQALARSTTMLIGLIVHDIADPYFSQIAAGAQAAADATKRQTLLAVTERNYDRTVALVHTFTAQRVDAIVLTGSQTVPPGDTRLRDALSTYQRAGGKVAVVASELEGFTAEAHIAPQNYEGARQLGERLAAQGCRDFTIIAGPETLDASTLRVAGFSDALTTAGLPAPRIQRAEFSREGGVAAGSEFARANPATGASGHTLFVVADVMAVGVLTALHQHGIDVPGQVRIAGFDDIPSAQDTYPPLTTVGLSLAQMGRAAVAGLFDGTPTPWSTWFAPEVVERGSTGA